MASKLIAALLPAALLGVTMGYLLRRKRVSTQAPVPVAWMIPAGKYYVQNLASTTAADCKRASTGKNDPIVATVDNQSQYYLAWKYGSSMEGLKSVFTWVPSANQLLVKTNVSGSPQPIVEGWVALVTNLEGFVMIVPTPSGSDMSTDTDNWVIEGDRVDVSKDPQYNVSDLPAGTDLKTLEVYRVMVRYDGAASTKFAPHSAWLTSYLSDDRFQQQRLRFSTATINPANLGFYFTRVPGS